MRIEIFFSWIRIRRLEDRFHGVRVGHEVGGEVALVELHAFDHVEGGLNRLGFLDRDGAVLADLVHGVGDDAADLRVPVGGNGCDLSDLLVFCHLRADLGEFCDDRLGGLSDAALQCDRVGARGDVT